MGTGGNSPIASVETDIAKFEPLSEIGNIPYIKALISSGLKSDLGKGMCKGLVGKVMVSPVINLMKDGIA